MSTERFLPLLLILVTPIVAQDPPQAERERKPAIDQLEKQNAALQRALDLAKERAMLSQAVAEEARSKAERREETALRAIQEARQQVERAERRAIEAAERARRDRDDMPGREIREKMERLGAAREMLAEAGEGRLAEMVGERMNDLQIQLARRMERHEREVVEGREHEQMERREREEIERHEQDRRRDRDFQPPRRDGDRPNPERVQRRQERRIMIDRRISPPQDRDGEKEVEVRIVRDGQRYKVLRSTDAEIDRDKPQSFERFRIRDEPVMRRGEEEIEIEIERDEDQPRSRRAPAKGDREVDDRELHRNIEELHERLEILRRELEEITRRMDK